MKMRGGENREQKGGGGIEMSQNSFILSLNSVQQRVVPDFDELCTFLFLPLARHQLSVALNVLM